MRHVRKCVSRCVLSVMLGVMLFACACSSGDDCEAESHSYMYCQDGILYWVDSCGDFEEIVEQCGCGCTEDHAACLSPCDCQQGWLDCGSGCIDPLSDEEHCGGCDKPCGENETCESGICVLGGDCPGVNLNNDGVLDLDLQAVRVSGQITLEGAALPDEPLGRGQLVFIESVTGSQLVVDLESSGPKIYELTLAPGVYHVDYQGNGALCSKEGAAFPCNAGRLMEGVQLLNDGVLDVDIPMVRVSGQVTLEGAELPLENMDRGQLVFELADGGQALSKPFDRSGPFAYELPLLPGVYTLRLDANEGLCTPSGTGEMPCIDGVLMDDLNLMNDGVLDVDIPTVKVSGQVTLAGGDLPLEDMNRGQILFVNASSGDAFSVDLERQGAKSYELVLLPAVYEVDFQGNPALCSEELAEMPCNSGRILSSLSLLNDGVLDVDIPVVRVSGQVTLEGAQLPQENMDRGQLLFSLSDGGQALSKSFGSSGAFDYALTLLPGNYTLSLQGNPALCTGVSPSQMPCNSGALMTDLNLLNDGVLDVDIPVVSVSGQVRLKGGALPSESLDRGSLSFVLGQSAVSSKPLGNSGAFNYEVTLLPGTYEIVFNGNPAFCTRETLSQMPCNSGAILSDLNLLNDGVLDVDIPAVRVSGQVSLEGAAMPAEINDRGLLEFVLRQGSAIQGRAFQSSGAVSYDLRLLPGNYLVLHRGNAGLCSPSLAQPQVPCNDQVLQGCL